jgi:hypothetical protein
VISQPRGPVRKRLSSPVAQRGLPRSPLPNGRPHKPASRAWTNRCR